MIPTARRFSACRNAEQSSGVSPGQTWRSGSLCTLWVAIMKLAEVYPDLDQRSSLPPGGDPRLDRAYTDWLRDWLDTAEPRALDALTGPDGEVCPGAAKLTAKLNPFRLTGHLAKWLIGWEFPSGTGPTYQHRLRFVAVQFYLRRAALVNEADAYLGRIIDELR